MTEKPIQEFRVNGGIKATVWKNRGEKGEFFTTTFSRSYRDANDEWKETGVFMPDQLPKLALAIGKAYEFIQLGHAKGRAANDNHSNDNTPSPESESTRGDISRETDDETFQKKVESSRQSGRRR